MVKSIVILLSSFFYVGFLPLVPGTFGSMAALLIIYLFKGNNAVYLLLALICTIVGFLVSGKAEEALCKKDARCIVIDEASGMFITFLFVPFDLKLLILGFIFFRILDTLKPPPADFIQTKKGSLGVMGDDLVAGLYANIILQLVARLASFRIS